MDNEIIERLERVEKKLGERRGVSPKTQFWALLAFAWCFGWAIFGVVCK